MILHFYRVPRDADNCCSKLYIFSSKVLDQVTLQMQDKRLRPNRIGNQTGYPLQPSPLSLTGNLEGPPLSVEELVGVENFAYENGNLKLD